MSYYNKVIRTYFLNYACEIWVINEVVVQIRLVDTVNCSKYRCSVFEEAFFGNKSRSKLYHKVVNIWNNLEKSPCFKYLIKLKMNVMPCN